MESSMSAMRELRPASVRQRKKMMAMKRPMPMLLKRIGILQKETTTCVLYTIQYSQFTHS